MRLILSLCAAALLAGCATVQNSSGAQYLERYEADLAAAATDDALAPRIANEKLLALNEEVREAALVEPILRLPARIGIAKIRRNHETDYGGYSRGDEGYLAVIPAEEAAEWAALAEKLGPDFGAFVPVNPLVARMVAGAIDDAPIRYDQFNHDAEARDAALEDLFDRRRRHDVNQAYGAIREARLGAARQHLDAVLVYDLTSNSRSEATLFSAANWTIIGAMTLPGRENAGRAQASAMLVDVRNGYPYATISTQGESTRYSSYMASDSSESSARRRAVGEAFSALIPEVEDMALQLALKLGRREIAAQ